MKNYILSFLIFAATSVFAQSNNSNWLEESIIRKAIAVTELNQVISSTVTDMQSAITYKNRTGQFGAQMFRVELDYKIVWRSGMSLQSRDYIVVLRSSGYTEIYQDDLYFLKEFSQKQFPDFEARQQFSLDTFSDGMMSAQFGQFMKLAKEKAEGYVATKTGHTVITHQTLVTGLSEQSLGRSNLIYKFEIVSQESTVKFKRQNIMILVNPETSNAEVFEEDPRFDSDFT